VPELNGKKHVVPGHENTNTIEADKPGVFLGACAEFCGLAHADMRFRVIAQPMDEWQAWLADQQRGPAQPLTGEVADLVQQKYQCTNCHIFDDSTKTNFGPNLTHLDSRTTFAGGTYALNRKNLTDWVLDAPSMVPMQSKLCRLPPPATCVGMPSFTKNTPNGDTKKYPTMTRHEAEILADYLFF
jgi:cytochrome c oxidase subunit 2